MPCSNLQISIIIDVCRSIRVIYKPVRELRYCDSYPTVFQGLVYSFIRRPVFNDAQAQKVSRLIACSSENYIITSGLIKLVRSGLLYL